MKHSVVVGGLFSLPLSLALSPLPPTHPFEIYKTSFGKIYESDAQEEIARRAFEVNMGLVEKLNAEQVKAGYAPVHGVNKFSDMPREEFAKRYLGYRRSGNGKKTSPANSVIDESSSVSGPTVAMNVRRATAHRKFDWRTKGCITPVKNQGQCGSCWAFSVTEASESAWNLTGHPLVELSVQEVVSCDKKDLGCDGGDPPTAYDQVIRMGGFESETRYPYTSGNGDSGRCLLDKRAIVAEITGFKYATPPCDEGSCDSQDIERLLTNAEKDGPPSICVDAEVWQTYTGGILRTGCGHASGDLDHCVQLVGANTEGKDPREHYVTVRNSWAEDWGEKGYIRLALAAEDGKLLNTCGFANEATFPEVDHKPRF